MKRLLCILLPVLLLCLPALAQERFEDPRIGAALDIPLDWSISGEEGQYLFLSADESICISLMALGMTAEEFTPEVMEEMRQQIVGSLAAMPDYQLMASEISRDPDDPGLQLMASYTTGEETTTQLVMVGLGNGEEMLSITCTFPLDYIDEAEDILHRILLPLQEDDLPEGGA